MVSRKRTAAPIDASLAAQAYNALEECIVTLRLKPGDEAAAAAARDKLVNLFEQFTRTTVTAEF